MILRRYFVCSLCNSERILQSGSSNSGLILQIRIHQFQTEPSNLDSAIRNWNPDSEPLSDLNSGSINSESGSDLFPDHSNPEPEPRPGTLVRSQFRIKQFGIRIRLISGPYQSRTQIKTRNPNQNYKEEPNLQEIRKFLTYLESKLILRTNNQHV